LTGQALLSLSSSFYMKNNVLNIFMLTFAIFILIESCSKETNVPPSDPVAGMVKIASGYAKGAATYVNIYTKDSAIAGYNKLYIVLTDSITGKNIDNASVTLNPIMQMAMMSHSSPKENPASIAVSHVFEASVTFIMPSAGGTWTLTTNVFNNENGKQGALNCIINVKPTTQQKLYSFISLSDNSSKYFVGIVEPSKPFVGINDCELVIYKKQSMMLFPADSSLTVVVIPEMPTMSHGSPNNINPVHMGNGHYKGKVNFTMTGFWRLNLTLKTGNTVADSTNYIDLTF
jgi:hypothetical protein